MSDRLRRLYTQKHREFPHYGESAKSHVTYVKNLIVGRKYKTFLDYGCGKAILSQEIPGVVNYDFAIAEYARLPQEKFDISFCIDVLEHIPEEELYETLSYLKAHSGSTYFCIHMGESVHKLANGEPCHCTVHPAHWWLGILGKYWHNLEIVSNGKLHITLIAS